MLIIVTGAIGIGKTTVCKKVIEQVRGQGYSCGGVSTCKAPDAGIIIEDVQTGKKETLAGISNIYHGPHTKKYFFNPEGIDFGIQAIDGGVSSDILLVDEVGPLELRGEGFVRVIELVSTGEVKNCIMVIRKELLSAFLAQLGATPFVFETTAANRNHLPGEIGLMLSRTDTAESAQTS